MRLGPKTAASLLSTNNDLQYIKCVAWCPGLETDQSNQLIAVGQANGKVALTSFSKVPDPRGLKGREFSKYLWRIVDNLALFFISGVQNISVPDALIFGLDYSIGAFVLWNAFYVVKVWIPSYIYFNLDAWLACS